MKTISNITILVVAFAYMSCQTTANKSVTENKVAEFENILDSLQVVGSILIYDYANNIYYSNDFDWAKEGNLPASTFKIPNSIIAVELGIIGSDTTVIKWNGESRMMDIWERDLTFNEAFNVSCVPCYQEIAREIGHSRMKDYLEKIEYKQMIFDSTTVDNFWLEGDSKISQKEQVEFLEKFYHSKLPVSARTNAIVKSIMVVEKTENYTFSGKTGWSVRAGKDNGWYVGFIETNTKVYFFATNITPKEGLKMADVKSARINATKEALKYLKIIASTD